MSSLEHGDSDPPGSNVRPASLSPAIIVMLLAVLSLVAWSDSAIPEGWRQPPAATDGVPPRLDQYSISALN